MRPKRLQLMRVQVAGAVEVAAHGHEVRISELFLQLGGDLFPAKRASGDLFERMTGKKSSKKQELSVSLIKGVSNVHPFSGVHAGIRCKDVVLIRWKLGFQQHPFLACRMPHLQQFRLPRRSLGATKPGRTRHSKAFILHCHLYIHGANKADVKCLFWTLHRIKPFKSADQKALNT